jgi:hypothetical protein
MSKQKKSKRVRQPNVYMGPVGTPSVVVGGGAETLSEARPARSEPGITFDYSHIKKDLARIGVLAVSFIVILVALSFILK